MRAIVLVPHCSFRREVKEYSMRLIFGMILGAFLTVGAAYVSDTASKPGPDARPMVNWDVVGRNVETLSTMIKQSWNKLTG